MQALQPSMNCLEYRLNLYHLHGIQNCAFCTQQTQQEVQNKEPRFELTEEEKLKYQSEVTQLQTKIKKQLIVSELNPEDPDVMMELLERYQDCPCCKGFVFNCDGQICEQLQRCYCLQKDLQDQLEK